MRHQGEIRDMKWETPVRDQGDKEKDHIETTPEFLHETKHQRKTSGDVIYNDGLHRPNTDDAGPIVCCRMGLPITAECDTAWM